MKLQEFKRADVTTASSVSRNMISIQCPTMQGLLAVSNVPRNVETFNGHTHTLYNGEDTRTCKYRKLKSQNKSTCTVHVHVYYNYWLYVYCSCTCTCIGSTEAIHVLRNLQDRLLLINAH